MNASMKHPTKPQIQELAASLQELANACQDVLEGMEAETVPSTNYSSGIRGLSLVVKLVSGVAGTAKTKASIAFTERELEQIELNKAMVAEKISDYKTKKLTKKRPDNKR